MIELNKLYTQEEYDDITIDEHLYINQNNLGIYPVEGGYIIKIVEKEIII